MGLCFCRHHIKGDKEYSEPPIISRLVSPSYKGLSRYSSSHKWLFLLCVYFPLVYTHPVRRILLLKCCVFEEDLM